MGSQGQINPYQGKNGSQLFDFIKMYQGLSRGQGDESQIESMQPSDGLPKGYNPAMPSQSQMPSIEDPKFGPSAMDKRAEALNNSPEMLISNGLKDLSDPNNGMDLQTRMSFVEPLLRAQHFGYGGGLDQPYKKGSQGQINSPEKSKDNSQGVAGMIGSLAALV